MQREFAPPLLSDSKAVVFLPLHWNVWDASFFFYSQPAPHTQANFGVFGLTGHL